MRTKAVLVKGDDKTWWYACDGCHGAIDYMERMKSMEMNDMSVQIGEYKGYKVRVMLRKPEEEQKEWN